MKLIVFFSVSSFPRIPCEDVIHVLISSSQGCSVFPSFILQYYYHYYSLYSSKGTFFVLSPPRFFTWPSDKWTTSQYAPSPTSLSMAHTKSKQLK